MIIKGEPCIVKKHASHMAGNQLVTGGRYAAVFAGAVAGGMGVGFLALRAYRTLSDLATTLTTPQPIDRHAARRLINRLQSLFVDRLEEITLPDGRSSRGEFAQVSWLRSGGKHGGGVRFELEDSALFNRVSINASGVHYDTATKAPIDSATALSVIIHPRNPHAPSMHLHVSLVEPRDLPAYWRLIADLNPSVEAPAAAAAFESALRRAVRSETLYTAGSVFGGRYFYIPDRRRTRGAAHCFIAKLTDAEMKAISPYLTRNCASTARATEEYVTHFVKRVLDAYVGIVEEALHAHPDSQITEAHASQLAFHTLYLFQVLTLDRGTTQGLLSHMDNDLGTLGSLPTMVDRKLLEQWLLEIPKPRDELLRRILAELPSAGASDGASDGPTAPVRITGAVRGALADVLRRYYREDKERIEHQAEMELDWWKANGTKALKNDRQWWWNKVYPEKFP